jgi:CBS domain-containing protein
MDTLVGDILNHKGWHVHAIGPGATVFEAIKEMVDLNIGALVVTDDAGQMVGIMTERDYLTKVALEGRSSRTTFVQEIMTDQVVVIQSDFTIEQCLVLMTEKRCRHLPVIRNSSVEGIISIGDCAREISDDRQITVQYFVDFIHRRYPA